MNETKQKHSGIAGPSPVRRRQYLFLVSFVLSFLVLDILLFRVLFWRLPNETAWDTAPLYNYERLARVLSRRKAPDEFRVLVAGSSIAHYAVDPERLAAGLSAPRNVRVEILAFQGQHPMHLRAASARIRDARPDLVLLPLGFVDFRPERPLVLGLSGDLESPAKREAALERLRRDLLFDQRFRVIAPAGWVRVYWSHLDAEFLSTGLLASLIASYRYKSILAGPAGLLLENRFSRGRHYHHYAGQAVGGGNVFHRGWTGRTFSLRLNSTLLHDGLWVEAPPELFAAAREKGRAPKLILTKGPGPGQEMILAPGWQRVPLAAGRQDGELHFTVEPGWDSDLIGHRLGVRLAGRTGRSEFARRGREERREDVLYRDYSDRLYRASFERRMRRFDRAGMEYLQSLEQARSFWAGRPFDPGLPAFTALHDWLMEMREGGIPVVLIIAPENPLSLGLYGDSDWYSGFRDFLAKLPASGLVNARDLLVMQDFYDHHHLSYFGARKFSDFLAAEPAVRRIASGP